MFRLLYSFVAIAVLLTAAPSQTFGQTAAAPPIKTSDSVEANEVLNCFDYYRFGSVQAVMSPSVTSAMTGAALTFGGQLTNANEYPLTDGTLYAKVFRNDETTFASGDGNLVVDQFVVKDDITLVANGVIDVAHEWTIPTNAKAGEYYIAYFFVTSDRYNLMGLTFTDSVVGNTAAFSVTSADGAIPPAELNKIDTTLNGINHNFMADSLTFKNGERVVIETTITNFSDEAKIIPLQWNQYAWDAMNTENRRNTKTEIVTLAPQETRTVTYEVKAQRENVVYVSVITQDKDAKSILNIRYAQDGIDETRLNFPGISTFPLKEGEAATLFACAQAVNSPLIDNNTLTLELMDKTGVPIYTYTYNGAITAEMAGFGETFIPADYYDYVTLNAKIERDGVVVEEVSVVYDCAVADASKCEISRDDEIAVDSSTALQQIVLIIVGFGSIVVTFIVIIIFFRRKGVGDISGPTIMSLTVFLLLGFSIVLPQGAEASVCPVDPLSWDCYTVRTIEGPNTGAEDKLCVPVGTTPPSTSGCFVTGYTTDPDVFQFNTLSVPGDYAACATNCPATTVASATMSGNGCTIPTGASTCAGTVTWTTNGANAPTVRNVTSDTLISSNANGTNVTTALTQGSNYLIVREGVSVLSDASLIATCGAGDIWNGSSCIASACQADGYTQYFIPPVCCSGNYSTNNFDSCTVYSNNQMPWGGSICIPTTEYTCAPSVAPTMNLTINGSDGPITVDNGDALAITWNGSNVASCTAYGAGWGSGTAVVISGTASINASVSDTYIINCNGVIDSVDVVVNAGGAPNAPTVTGPVTSSVGTSNVFVINATDVDGDTIYYEIDWNNDGVTDAYTPGVGYIPSGTDRIATQSWGSGGAYTFAVRAIDDTGLSSGWTTHTVAVASALTVTIEAQVNSGVWSSGDQTINPGDTITIRWSSTDATTCTGTNVNTGGTNNSAGVAVSEPAPNSSLSYQIQCSGAGGTVTEDIIVTTRQLPNLTQPSVTFTPSVTVDSVTGDYDSVEVRFQTGNDGGSNTNTTVTYIVEIDYGNDGSYDVSQTGTIPSIATGGTVNGSETFTDVPFGNNTIRVTIDTNNDVTEVNETDNSRTLAMTLLPMVPNFTLTASPNIVREGQTAAISWNTVVAYPLNCMISGPALTAYSFDPSVSGTTGSRTTGLLSSKSEYTLSCTEPVTNTTFTESASVDIIPNAEEI